MTTPIKNFSVTVYFENHPRLNKGGFCELSLEGKSPKHVACKVHDIFKSSGYEFVKIKTSGILKYEEWQRKDLENISNINK